MEKKSRERTRIGNLKFMLEKLQETEGSLASMRRQPFRHKRELYAGLLEAYEGGLNYIETQLREVALNPAPHEKVQVQLLADVFKMFKKRHVQAAAEDLSQVLFADKAAAPKPAPVSKDKPLKEPSLKPPSRLNPGEKSAPVPQAQQTLVEVEGVEDMVNESTKRRYEENMQINRLMTEIVGMTQEMAPLIEQQAPKIEEIHHNVQAAKEEAAVAVKEIAAGAKYSWWRTKLGAFFGGIGAAVGFIVNPIVGTIAGGATGAAAGIKVADHIDNKISAVAHEDDKESGSS